MRPRDLAKRLGRMLGLEVRPFRPSSSHAAQLRVMLDFHRINLIFDIGANAGQFGKELRGHVGYRGRIVSFEPMNAAHQALTRAAAKDQLWEVARRLALGAERGSITLNVARNSLSSSILPMLASHTTAAPESCYDGTELTPLLPLDAVSPEYFREDSVAFLKIDTQGYESQVLQGARETLTRVAGVQLELSLVPLYAGQKLMPELIASINGMGFELWGITPMFADPATGRLLQVDATFFRRRA